MLQNSELDARAGAASRNFGPTLEKSSDALYGVPNASEAS